MEQHMHTWTVNDVGWSWLPEARPITTILITETQLLHTTFTSAGLALVHRQNSKQHNANGKKKKYIRWGTNLWTHMHPMWERLWDWQSRMDEEGFAWQVKFAGCKQAAPFMIIGYSPPAVHALHLRACKQLHPPPGWMRMRQVVIIWWMYRYRFVNSKNNVLKYETLKKSL